MTRMVNIERAIKAAMPHLADWEVSLVVKRPDPNLMTILAGDCSDLDCLDLIDMRCPSPPRIPASTCGKKNIRPNLRWQVFRRDGHKCAYCGTTKGKMHLDHIIPKSRGGLNTLENLTVACSACNWSKGNKLLSEWRQN